MDDADATQLRTNVQSLQKDVESKAATIKHLQNALDAKSMTIGILSKHNREGGDIEEKINVAVQSKITAAVKSKDDELAALNNRMEQLEKTTAGVDSSVEEDLRTSLAERQRLESALKIQKDEMQRAKDKHEEEMQRAKDNHEQDSVRISENLRQALQAEHQDALRQAVETAKGELQDALEMETKLGLQLQADKAGLEKSKLQLEAALEEEKRKLITATEDLRTEVEAVKLQHEGSVRTVQNLMESLKEAEDKATVAERLLGEAKMQAAAANSRLQEAQELAKTPK